MLSKISILGFGIFDFTATGRERAIREGSLRPALESESKWVRVSLETTVPPLRNTSLISYLHRQYLFHLFF